MQSGATFLFRVVHAYRNNASPPLAWINDSLDNVGTLYTEVADLLKCYSYNITTTQWGNADGRCGDSHILVLRHLFRGGNICNIPKAPVGPSGKQLREELNRAIGNHTSPTIKVIGPVDYSVEVETLKLEDYDFLEESHMSFICREGKMLWNREDAQGLQTFMGDRSVVVYTLGDQRIHVHTHCEQDKFEELLNNTQVSMFEYAKHRKSIHVCPVVDSPSHWISVVWCGIEIECK